MQYVNPCHEIIYYMYVTTCSLHNRRYHSNSDKLVDRVRFVKEIELNQSNLFLIYGYL